MLAVVLLAVVLVALPLYLWRRPRSIADPVAGDGGTQDAALVGRPFESIEVDASSALALRLGDARVIECRDSGSKRVPSEQCDALPSFAKGFAEAILAAKDCIPKGVGPGSITYVADVGFSRRRAPVTVALRRCEPESLRYRSKPSLTPTRVTRSHWSPRIRHRMRARSARIERWRLLPSLRRVKFRAR
jgi:hypothetical protein